ncbi:uncharacterized protein [Palaemon carinicauda]|uniref:uncharacterized protein n=1 Tax=Palaemon carinicauda TaxID=392227 RepID=UPI0035B65E12
MGDNNHACRGFETPSLGSDLWPMGFDVDLALETPGTRKDPGSSLNSGLVNVSLNSLHSTGANSSTGGYNDIHHLTGLSSILQRSDDLHTGDICQMTDLTNSLPKGDSESAQSLLAKLACHDLGPDLTGGVDANHKEIETALFDQNAAALSHAAGNGVSNVLSQKNSLETADVYGRMTCYGGKLILQLRHFNLNTNYTLNVTECWLCGDKINAGPQLCTHKHSLNGLFQVNDEYVQLEIEHYIIPEHALDTPDSQDMTDNMLQHPGTSGLHQDMSTTRDMEMTESLPGNGDTLGLDNGSGVNIGGNGAALHYTGTPDNGLMPSLSVAPNLLSHAMGNQPCLNQSFGQLPLPSMSVSNMSVDMNSNIPDIVKNERIASSGQPLCSISAPVIGASINTPVMDCPSSTSIIGLTHSTAVSSSPVMPAPVQRKIPMHTNQMSLVNNYAVDNVLNSFSVDEQLNNPTMPNQSVLRDVGAQNKSTLPYHLPFSDGDYACPTSENVSNIPEKHMSNSCLTPLDSVSLNLESQPQQIDGTAKKHGVGSKKRKGRVQRKTSAFQDSSNRTYSPETVSTKMLTEDASKKSSVNTIKIEQVESNPAERRQISRSDASFEDWFRRNLPEDDLIVTGNSLKNSNDIVVKLETTETYLESNDIKKEITEKSPKSREPDQTSRLADHMLRRGIDLMCRVCQKDFGKNIKVYKVHMKEHGINETELFACCFCTKMFSKWKHYTQHLRTHVKNHRFSCRLCTASYSRYAKLQRHMLSHGQETPKNFECEKCSKSFTTKYYLNSHLSSHSEKKFKCDTCGFLCSNLYNLDVHKKSHLSDKPFKCKICEKTFLRKDFLKNHIDNIHENKKLTCEICGKLFSRKDVLKRHIAVHNNEKHECEICGKKFTRKDILLTHLKSHKSTAVYKCSICPASFVKKYVLDKHEKIHEVKEQCKICYTFLPSKVSLLNHMKLHSPENSKEENNRMHKCEICSKSMTTKDILRKHMRKIHGKFPKTMKQIKPIEREKRFFCQWCSKGFTRSCNLNSHLLKAHSKDTEDEFEDDLSSVLKSKLESNSAEKNTNLSSSALSSSTSSYQSVASSSTAVTSVSGVTGVSQNSNFLVVGPFTGGLPSASPSSSPPHPSPALPVSSHFPSSGPPDSPINLSTDAITAAAYLLAYLSYPGPY